MKESEYKTIITLAIGAVGGFLLGNYLKNKIDLNMPLSKQLTVLSEISEQLEKADVDDVKDIKERINKILDSIDLNYENTKR
jgi:hypothetical protein